MLVRFLYTFSEMPFSEMPFSEMPFLMHLPVDGGYSRVQLL